MKINTINQNFNFQKRPVATCQIKKYQTKEKADCTIYELNPKDLSDVDEVIEYREFEDFRADFLKEQLRRGVLGRYLIMQDDKTGENVSCAEFSQHTSKYPLSANYEKFVALDDIDENLKYVDSMSAMLGYVSYVAEKFGAQKIKTSFRQYDKPEMILYKMTPQKDDTMEIRRRGFYGMIDRAEQRHNLEIN